MRRSPTRSAGPVAADRSNPLGFAGGRVGIGKHLPALRLQAMGGLVAIGVKLYGHGFAAKIGQYPFVVRLADVHRHQFCRRLYIQFGMAVIL